MSRDHFSFLMTKLATNSNTNEMIVGALDMNQLFIATMKMSACCDTEF